MKTLILNFLSLLILGWLFHVITYNSWLALLLASFVLALLNATLRPVLQLLFLPMNLITLGIFGWLINGLVLGLSVFLVPGVQLHNLVLGEAHFGFLISLMVLSLMITITQRLLDLVI